MMAKKKNVQIDNPPAFVIGNGLSRSGIDLNEISTLGTTFGCNALYRDFNCDYLVAIDQPIIDEIRASDYPQDQFIVPTTDEQLESLMFHRGQYRPRSNAGTNAILEAIKKGHTHIFCLGFDFLIANKGMSTANIYDNTVCYEPATRASYMDNINRAKYLEWVCNYNSHARFYMVFPREKFTVHSVRAPNITGIYYDMITQYANRRAGQK